jgi:hypothetical protein
MAARPRRREVARQPHRRRFCKQDATKVLSICRPVAERSFDPHEEFGEAKLEVRLESAQLNPEELVDRPLRVL